MKRKWIWRGAGEVGGSIVIDYDAGYALVSNKNAGTGKASIEDIEHIISNFALARLTNKNTFITDLQEVEIDESRTEAD